MTATGGRTGLLNSVTFKGTLRRDVYGPTGWNDRSISFLTTVVAAARQQDGSKSIDEASRLVRRLLGLPGNFRFGIVAVGSSKLVSGDRVLDEIGNGGGGGSAGLFGAYVGSLATKALAGERGVSLNSSGFSFLPSVFATAIPRLVTFGKSMLTGIPAGVGSGAGSALFGWVLSMFKPDSARPATAADVTAIHQEVSAISKSLSDTRREMTTQYESLVGRLETLTNSVECEGAKTRYTTLAASLNSAISDIENLQVEMQSLADYEVGSLEAQDAIDSINVTARRLEAAPTLIYNTLRNDGTRQGLLSEAWQRLRACTLATNSPVLDARASNGFRTVVSYWGTVLKTLNDQLVNYWTYRYGKDTSTNSTAKRIKRLELIMTEIRDYVPPAIPAGVAYDPTNERMWAKPHALVLDSEGIPAGDIWRVRPNWTIVPAWASRSALDFGGFSDWRIPTTAQIQTLTRLAAANEDPWRNLANASPENQGGVFPTTVGGYSVRGGGGSASVSSGGYFLFYETFQGWEWLYRTQPVPALLTADYQSATAVVHRPCQPSYSEWKPLNGNAAWGGYRYVPLDRWVDDRTKSVWRLSQSKYRRWDPCPAAAATFRFSTTYMPPWGVDLNFDAGDRPGVNANGSGWSSGRLPFEYSTPAGEPGMLSLPTRVVAASESPQASSGPLPSIIDLNNRITSNPYPQ